MVMSPKQLRNVADRKERKKSTITIELTETEQVALMKTVNHDSFMTPGGDHLETIRKKVAKGRREAAQARVALKRQQLDEAIAELPEGTDLSRGSEGWKQVFVAMKDEPTTVIAQGPDWRFVHDDLEVAEAMTHRWSPVSGRCACGKMFVTEARFTRHVLDSVRGAREAADAAIQHD